MFKNFELGNIPEEFDPEWQSAALANIDLLLESIMKNIPYVDDETLLEDVELVRQHVDELRQYSGY